MDDKQSMESILPAITSMDTRLLMGLSIIVGGFAIIGLLYFYKLSRSLTSRFLSSQTSDIYQQAIAPYQNWLINIFFLVATDLVLLILPTPDWLKYIEVPLGLSIAIAIGWLGYRLLGKFFDLYLLEAAVQSHRKINSEILILTKFSVNTALLVTIVFIFAQTHQINILGLLASLGIGGLAVAFAAQKTLEQLLGGIVIYLDRPFVVDDYIGLPDGTFGRVESIGLRSTKIRTSGKGTLVIAPNSSLTQISIENYTGAKKIVSLIYLTFYLVIPEEEKALIRQVILDSTTDIFGIDSRSTEVIFKDIIQNENGNIQASFTKAQINFFILGSGEVSMDLRRQLLDIAKQNITKKLKDYGINFEIEDKTINVDSPITI